MKQLLIVALVLLALGCGKIPHLPDEADQTEVTNGYKDPYIDCEIYDVDFDVNSIPYTPMPFPFKGTRKASATANMPDWWSDVPEDATIHFKSMNWDGGWISQASLELEANGYILASWADEEWTVSTHFNIKPHLREDGESLVMDLRVRAVGIKPAGKVIIHSVAEFYVCEKAVEVEPPPDQILNRQDEQDAGIPTVGGPGTSNGCLGSC